MSSVVLVAALAFSFHLSLPAAPAAENESINNLFETSPDVTVTASGMMVTTPQVRMLMMVKRTGDGSLVTQCIESAEAAEQFLRPKTRSAGALEPQEK